MINGRARQDKRVINNALRSEVRACSCFSGPSSHTQDASSLNFAAAAAAAAAPRWQKLNAHQESLGSDFIT